MDARQLLDVLLDTGTFYPWNAPLPDPRPDTAYAADLAEARRHTGLDESVITGEGLLRGRRVAVMACEFAFLGGSIGVAAAERLTQAVERATAERLPLLALPASGGTRMQEGTTAFVQMIKIAAAVTTHKAAGLPYLVYLRHPTTGGVFASWGSLGHLTAAEPGALIGFLGPRVYQALHDSPFPKDAQTAENLHEHDLIDTVCPPEQLAALWDRALTVITAPTVAPLAPAPAPAPDESAPLPVWQSVLASRHHSRPGTKELLNAEATDVTTLHTQGLVLALARFGDNPCLLVGHDRHGPPPDPATLQHARRGMHLAESLRLPLVTVIDTAGAELSQQAEEGGLAREIAHCLTDLLSLRTPTVSLLLGQGAGGAALALLPADRVLAAQNAWLSPLPPEGASAIVFRDTGHAPQLAHAQRIRSTDLLADGIVDTVIAEAPGAPQRLCPHAGQALQNALGSVHRIQPATRSSRRLRRYRKLGL